MIWKNVLRFILLVFVQSAILSQIGLPLNLHVFLYIYFMLLLPYQIKDWLVLLLGFASGMMVDILMGTLGIFAFSMTVASFTRVIFFRVAKANEAGQQKFPSLKDMKFRNFFLYVSLVSFVHSIAFFMLDAFSFSHFGHTLFLIIGSTIFTSVAILFCNIIFVSKE